MLSNNPFTQDQFDEGIARWPKTPKEAHARARSFAKLKQTIASTEAISVKPTDEALASLEGELTKLQPLLREASEVEKEGYGQVCFRGSPWSQLNNIPFALLFFSLYKSYILPSLSVLLPVITCILPYILLKVMYKIPIPFTQYVTILMNVFKGNASPKSFLTPTSDTEPKEHILTRLKTFATMGWGIFTFGQTMWQPIQQARHFQTLDANCLSLGHSVLRVKEIASKLHSSWTHWMPSWLSNWIDLCPDTPRQAFAFILDTPFWLRHLLRALGRFEVLWRLARRPDVCAARFVTHASPVLQLRGFGDPAIPIEKRVLSHFTLGLDGLQHAIVTGPNRGGKSSFLRALLQNVRLAHAFGAAYAEQATLTPFTWIADGLTLHDTPGKLSMFEREVAFAAGVLGRVKGGGYGLVFYDELFHSTNPPDAKRASELFCSQLWKSNGCLSVLSTHIYSLAEQAPATVKKVCLASWRRNTGRFVFSYKVKKGICQVSSVDLLLKQFGFVTAAAQQPKSSASDQI